MIVKKKIDVPQIPPKKIVALRYLGNIREVLVSARLNSSATIIPLSKEEYILASTGEIKEFQHEAADRTGNLRNLQKTMRRLADLINTNVMPETVNCCRFITLTYREITDTEQLYTDYKNFNKRFKRYMKKLEYQYEYIVTVEAQARGALHIHGIFIFDKDAPFIENTVLANMWGRGFVLIRALDKNIDNIGKYLTAYLSDLPIEDEAPSEVMGGEIKKTENKRIIKGARLKLLPVGIRIFRYSRGIKKPLVVKLPYQEALEQLAEEGYTLVDEYAIEIEETGRNFKNTYIKKSFKKYINTSYEGEKKERRYILK